MRLSSSLIPLSLVALSLTAIPRASLGSPAKSGIQGQAFLYISYGTPTEVGPGIFISPGDVQLPVSTSFTVLSARNGREVAQVETEADGNFALSLHPGNYVLVPQTLRMALGCTVSTGAIDVTVEAREFTLQNVFYFDDGACTISRVFGSGP